MASKRLLDTVVAEEEAEGSLEREIDDYVSGGVDWKHEEAELKKKQSVVDKQQRDLEVDIESGVDDLNRIKSMIGRALIVQRKSYELLKSSGLVNVSYKDKVEADNRSIYVGNVEYSATEEDLQMHFSECGVIQRITILRNLFDGHPKGCAYIEFDEEASVQSAMTMDGCLFKGREITVTKKRTNHPGWSQANRRFRSGYRGRRSYPY